MEASGARAARRPETQRSDRMGAELGVDPSKRRQERET